MIGLFRSNRRFPNPIIYRIRSISVCQVAPNHKKRQLKASMQKYEMKRKLLEIQKQELKQQQIGKQIGKEYKSSVERSLFSLLFSNKIDYKEKQRRMDARCDNLRLICDLDSTKLGVLQTIFEEQQIKISGQLQIPISSTKFNNLMLLDCNSKNTLTNIPRICSFNKHNLTLEEIKPELNMTKPIGVEGQTIMETIRYMNRKPANVQLSVLTKSQFVHDDGALLERYFLAHYINSFLREKYNFDGYELRPYGSAVTGFANKYSDLDLCVLDLHAGDFSEKTSFDANFRQWRSEARQCMSELHSAMNPEPNRCHVPGIARQQLVDTAKHPIIKSEFIPLNLEFDFSYMDPSLLSMAQLHNYYSSLDPRVIPFIGSIRLWAKLHGYASHGLSGQLTPYIITQMALNYLQNIGFIPQIKNLKEKVSQKKLHLGEDISFEPILNWNSDLNDSYLEMNAAERMGLSLQKYRENNPVIQDLYKNDNLHILLFGFMDFIERFDQRKYKLCSLTGKPIIKDHPTGNLYVSHPFAPNKNIATAVRYDEYLHFKLGCGSNKFKFLYDLFNVNSFPSLKAQKREDLIRDDVDGWTGLAAFLNPYIRFDPINQKPYMAGEDAIQGRHAKALQDEGITRKAVGMMLQDKTK